MKTVIINVMIAAIALLVAGTMATAQTAASNAGRDAGQLDHSATTVLQQGDNIVNMPDGSFLKIELKDVLVTSVQVKNTDGSAITLHKTSIIAGGCDYGHSCWADKGNMFQVCICFSVNPGVNTGRAGGVAPVDSAGTQLTIGTKPTAAVAIPSFVSMRKRI